MVRLLYCALALSAFLLLGACATRPVAEPADDREAKLETKIYTFTECPVTGPEKPTEKRASALGLAVISALVSPLIEGVVDKGVEALKEAAKDKDFTVPAPAPVIRDFYEIGYAGDTRLNPAIGCIVLVRGKFETGKFAPVREQSAKLRDLIAAKFRVVDDKTSDVTRLRRNEYPAFYFEVVPVMSDNGKVFGFRPQALYIGEFFADDGFFGPKKRTYNITLTFSDPFGNEAFASAAFKFEGVARGEEQKACAGVAAAQDCREMDLGGIHGWFATNPVSDALVPALKKRQSLALTVKNAITDWSEPPPRQKVADDVPAVREKQDEYCGLLEAVNKAKAAQHQQWDANCTGALARAKREYMYLQGKEAARLDKAAADRYWAEKCRDGDGNVLPKNESGAVTCLKKINEPARTGKFLLTSAIIETRPGSEVARFLAPAAEKVAPTIKEELKKKLDPVERKKAAEAEETKSTADAKARRDAVRAATLADGDARIAQREYDDVMAALAKDPNNSGLQIESIKKQMSLLKAQAAANDAYRAAGLPIPYPTAD